MLNRTTDIIRSNNRDYVNINSKSSLIKRMITACADDIYSFGIRFGSKVDAETAKEMQGTYWANVQTVDATVYGEDIQNTVL